MMDEVYPAGSEASSTIKNRLLNQFYKRLYRLTQNTESATATTVASQLEYVLPANNVTVKHVVWDTASQNVRLTPRSTDAAYRYDEDWRTTTGTPAYYNVEGDRLRVFPVDAVGSKTLAIWYYGEPDDMSDDADVPDLPDDWDEILVDGAVSKVALRLKDYEAAREFGRLWNEGYERAKRDVSNPQVDTPQQVEDARGLGF
jgi:hypothetical protein